MHNLTVGFSAKVVGGLVLVCLKVSLLPRGL